MAFSQLLMFLPAAILVALTPGANNLLSMTNGMRLGFVAATISIFGRMAAFTLLIVLVALGLGALLEASEVAFTVIKWVGVAYLVYLGVSLWHSAGHDQSSNPHQASPERRALSYSQLARHEFFVAITNPKSLVVFTAFLPQFIDPTAGFASQLFFLGAIYLVIEYAAASCYALAGATIGRADVRPHRMRWIQRGMGGTMLGAAAMLAMSERK